MKILFPIVIFFHCFSLLSAQEDSLSILEEFENLNMQATSILISTQGYSLENKGDSSIQVLNESSELIVLSLVDSTLYNNWETQVESYANEYPQPYVLVVVAIEDSFQKMEFIAEFYQQQSQEGDVELAYQQAVAILEGQYSALDFKHFFRRRE